jgi:hypothetical protein
MPLPTPNKGESQDDFISRCAGSDVMNKEFPDNDQRVAVCYSQWRDAKKESTTTQYDSNVLKEFLNDDSTAAQFIDKLIVNRTEDS